VYTQRQRAVAQANHQSTIYTPEFVVDGVEVHGSHKITSRVEQTHASLAEADLTLTLSDVQDGRLEARVLVEALSYAGDDIPQVYLVVYESGLSSQISAGENTGRTLKHDYVVRFLSSPQDTTAGQEHPFEVRLDPGWNPSGLGVSAIIKLKNSGRTLQAVKGVL